MANNDKYIWLFGNRLPVLKNKELLIFVKLGDECLKGSEIK